MNHLFMSKLPSGLFVSGRVEQRLLAEYGAMFVAQGVTVPDRIVFRDEEDVSTFQSGLSISAEMIDGFRMELQAPAMEALRRARNEALKNGLAVSPRDADSARRRYSETIELWASRVEPALVHWVGIGRLTNADADRLRALAPFEQVAEIFALEEQGIYFAKDLLKSIVYSVAPPGTSQHLSMIAFDIKEHENAELRKLLAKHKWYQTVVSDLPHFTYLGVDESELPKLGLKNVTDGERAFWVPDI